MQLLIMGFLPEPHDDDSEKFSYFVKPDQEERILQIIGWHSLNEGCDGVQDLDAEQTLEISRLLSEPRLLALSLSITTCF